jgi:hypothetical protein
MREQMTTTMMTLNDHLVELGTLEDNKETAPQRVGARLVQEYLETCKEYHVLDKKQLANLLYYLTDIQVRDYALGLLTPDKGYSQEYALRLLLEAAPTDTVYVNAPACMLGILQYELHEKETALLTISNAQDSYPLSTLLRRVFTSGWEPTSFAEMRKELHPQVTAGIFGESDDNSK